MANVERLHIFVRGVVQGVGYRYFVVRAAQRYELTGWVQNCPDGAVEVVAEGRTGALADFVADLKTGPITASVRDVHTEPDTYTAEYERFEVRY